MLGDVNDNGEAEFTEIRTAHTTGRAGLRPQDGAYATVCIKITITRAAARRPACPVSAAALPAELLRSL